MLKFKGLVMLIFVLALHVIYFPPQYAYADPCSNTPSDVEEFYIGLGDDFAIMLMTEPAGTLKDIKVENYREMLQIWNRERGCYCVTENIDDVINIKDVITVLVPVNWAKTVI